MAKSAGSFVILKDVIEEDINPLAFRYLTLTAHYRAKLEFSWKSLDAASNALNKLYERLREFDKPKGTDKEYEARFLEAINNDLDMPAAVALVWELLKDKKVDSGAKTALLYKFDEVLGLGLEKVKEEKIKIPKEVTDLADQRIKARDKKDWKLADDLRKQISDHGYSVEDTDKGYKLKQDG